MIFAKVRILWTETAPATISGLLDEIVDDNVMLVGEAVGQVIPLTGEDTLIDSWRKHLIMVKISL